MEKYLVFGKGPELKNPDQNDQNDQKWSKMIKNDQKWSKWSKWSKMIKMIKNDQKWSKIINNNQRDQRVPAPRLKLDIFQFLHFNKYIGICKILHAKSEELKFIKTKI